MRKSKDIIMNEDKYSGIICVFFQIKRLCDNQEYLSSFIIMSLLFRIHILFHIPQYYSSFIHSSILQKKESITTYMNSSTFYKSENNVQKQYGIWNVEEFCITHSHSWYNIEYCFTFHMQAY